MTSKDVFAGYASALDPRFAIGGWSTGGNLRGFAIAYPDHRGPRRATRAVLFMLGITPEESARRRGLGRALCYHCVSALLDADFDSLVVALLADDSPAWSLFGDHKKDAQKQYALYEAGLEA